MKISVEFGSMTFYREWLPLDKKEFRILAMIADKGEYKGNLSEICEYLSLNPQTRNRNQISSSIQALVEQGFVNCIKQGRTYTLKAIPKEKKIEKIKEISVAQIFAEAISRIHEGTSVSTLFD